MYDFTFIYRKEQVNAGLVYVTSNDHYRVYFPADMHEAFGQVVELIKIEDIWHIGKFSAAYFPLDLAEVICKAIYEYTNYLPFILDENDKKTWAKGVF